MAAKKQDTWDVFREKMKDKRCKKGQPAVNKKGLSAGDLIVRNGELVVQRLSSEVSGKAQKYSRIGAREFVPFNEEVSIHAIKAACERHYKSLSEEGLKCDVLAGDQGPSCLSMEHVRDLKVVHVRFIKPQINRPSTSFVSKGIMREENPAFSFMSECVHLRESPDKRKIKSERCSSSAAKRPAPKSLTVSQMIKLGKLIKPSVADTTHTMIIDVFSFDFSSGFRKAYKASSNTAGFEGKDWVVKRYLEKVVNEVTNDLGQSMEEQTKKVVQMHHLSKNFADQLSKTVKQKNICEKFGPVMQFQMVYFGKIQGTGECITIERYIKGEFVKYVNNTGELCVSSGHLLGQKAECLVHFSYEKSNHQLMVLDLQGSSHMLFDPEVASKKLVGEENEFMFCAGNLSADAIKTFVQNHKCNKFCQLLGLNSIA
ncbi:transient receptor potential cation channel subfamily M member 6-like [Paramuricea clavata]|uniref:Transient receptor potential cation channel subfamily M member 6-like n=1 Tax=Paramuricea clavata TaxID=317549 RepID=A0A7D9H7Q8_PARCT|nr:transient receptor potential cation channel subfamily M member 6-like [Paramuricea clavata]